MAPTSNGFMRSSVFWGDTKPGTMEKIPWWGKDPVEEDIMPRHPQLSVPGFMRFCDYFGTWVFAISGTLTAATSGLDLLGCVVVGSITALGGGTARDMIMGQGRRAFWFDEPEYLWISVLTSFATFFLWTQVSSATGVEEDGAAMFWSDALGLGAFCVIGAQNAIRARLPLVTALVTAGLTCTGGGVIRDTLCKRPVRVINSHMELYGSTALSGICVYFAMRRLAVPLPVRILGGMTTCIGMRYASWTYNLKLPTHPNGDAVLKAYRASLSSGINHW